MQYICVDFITIHQEKMTHEMVNPKTLNKWMRFVISPVKQNPFDLVQFFHSLKQFYKELQSI